MCLGHIEIVDIEHINTCESGCHEPLPDGYLPKIFGPAFRCKHCSKDYCIKCIAYNKIGSGCWGKISEIKKVLPPAYRTLNGTNTVAASGCGVTKQLITYRGKLAGLDCDECKRTIGRASASTGYPGPISDVSKAYHCTKCNMDQCVDCFARRPHGKVINKGQATNSEDHRMILMTDLFEQCLCCFKKVDFVKESTSTGKPAFWFCPHENCTSGLFSWRICDECYQKEETGKTEKHHHHKNMIPMNFLRNY